MTIDEAIKILEGSYYKHTILLAGKDDEALKLGIEALKLYRVLKQESYLKPPLLLIPIIKEAGYICQPEPSQDKVEAVAKWLFKNKHRLPNQRFYGNWYDEITASPLTEKEYLNLAREILKLFPEYEPVELEALGSDRQCDILDAVNKIHPGLNVKLQNTFSNLVEEVSQATIQKNQAKGQLFRVRCL